MKKFIFLKNAIILTITSFILRFLGMVLRIYMSNNIGAEGMGLYQLILSIYVMASTFATAGVSTAVIKIISDELISGSKISVNRALKKSMIISFSFGITSTILIFILANPIGKYVLHDTRTIPALKILVLAFPFMSITSCLKGYFLATKNVSTPSNAQLFEQIVRILLIFFLLKSFSHLGITVCCVIIMISDVIAESCSCLYSFWRYFIYRKTIKTNHLIRKNKERILKKFFSVAIPVAGTRYVNSFLHTIENILVPNKLRTFHSSHEKALEEFGIIKGMAIPLLFFPASFITAISTLLLPEMSEAYELHHKEKIRYLTEKTLKLTIISSILISGLFFTFSFEISEVIYKNTQVGHIIKMLAPIVPFMYIESMIMGLLQGLNQQMSSLKYIITDSIIRIILIFFLVPTKGLEGFIYIMIISNIYTSCSNLYKLLKVSNAKIDFKNWILKPLFSLLSGNIVLLYFNKIFNLSTISYLIFGIIIISISYILGIFISHAIKISELKSSTTDSHNYFCIKHI